MERNTPQYKKDGKVQLWSYQTKTRAAQAAYLASFRDISKADLIDEIVAKEVDNQFEKHLSGLIDAKAEALAVILADAKFMKMIEELTKIKAESNAEAKAKAKVKAKA